MKLNLVTIFVFTILISCGKQDLEDQGSPDAGYDIFDPVAETLLDDNSITALEEACSALDEREIFFRRSQSDTLKFAFRPGHKACNERNISTYSRVVATLVVPSFESQAPYFKSNSNYVFRDIVSVNQESLKVPCGASFDRKKSYESPVNPRRRFTISSQKKGGISQVAIGEFSKSFRTGKYTLEKVREYYIDVTFKSQTYGMTLKRVEIKRTNCGRDITSTDLVQ